jgi:Shwachman-Bodian-Diamond syndrome (SBDS) protein
VLGQSCVSMPNTGEGQQARVHYKGSDDDFLVFVEDVASLKKWRGDKTVPLVDVVQSFDVFVTGQCAPSAAMHSVTASCAVLVWPVACCTELLAHRAQALRTAAMTSLSTAC